MADSPCVFPNFDRRNVKLILIGRQILFQSTIQVYGFEKKVS